MHNNNATIAEANDDAPYEVTALRAAFLQRLLAKQDKNTKKSDVQTH